VRQPVGYPHFDLAPELVLLHQLWTLDALFTNYLLAQQESIEKHRHYVRVTKCHGRAQTPHERALSHLEISEITRTTLKATFATIHRAAPCDQIRTLTSQLAHISFTRGLAPIRRVQKTLNRPLHPEVLDEAMDQASRRI
jgi:hypothetical protein